jgi:hypothetical protein
MSSTVAVILPLTLVPVVVIAIARRCGRRAAARETLPWRPIFQLVEHRTRCLGHDPARVERDLGPILGIPAWAWRELFALRRPLDRRRPSGSTPEAPCS